jgi:hypothetical protein
VSRIRGGHRGWKRARRVVIGRSDEALTGSSGLAAVTELDARLAIVRALDAGIGSVEDRDRDRGLSAGELVMAMACVDLAGVDHLVGLDRQRTDVAGQRLGLVATPASTRAAGLARRFAGAHLAGIEAAVGQVNARVLGLVGQVRRSALCKQVTLDFDTTDIEVYGPRKDGVDYNCQGQRCGRAHIGFWAELGVPVVADLGDGRSDPRSAVVGLLRRGLAALPEQAKSTGTNVRVRVDGGYFAAGVPAPGDRFRDRRQTHRPCLGRTRAHPL